MISSATTKSTGKQQLDVVARGLLEHLLGRLDPLVLDEASAHIHSLRDEKREAHPAADYQGIDARRAAGRSRRTCRKPC
jgi:hypothetical protein